MTDTTQEWTPEARKIREAEHRVYCDTLTECGSDRTAAERLANKRYPLPPPEYTYGPVLDHGPEWLPERRRSDGKWELRLGDGWSKQAVLTDAITRRRAAEVPLSDAECDYLLVQYPHATIRTAFARVLRGEVK